MDRADVVVVGAGLAGTAVGWHLAADASVLVLEQGDEVGAEATADSAGMIRCLGEDPWERELAIRTARFLDDPGPDWADEEVSRPVGAVLGLAWDTHHLHDGVAHLRARGVRVESCDRPSEVAPALAGSPLRQAWYLPDERVAQPQALVRGFVKGIGRRDGRVGCSTRVIGLCHEGGRCVGVRTDAGEVAAGAVVLAGGAWTAALAWQAGLHRPLIPLRRSAFRSQLHPMAHSSHPWCWIDDAGAWLRPDVGRWMVSPCEEWPSWPSPGPGSRGEPLAWSLELVRERLARYFPALGTLVFEDSWTGLRTFAPDRRPVLGKDPELDNLWWCGGLGGFGVTCGYAAGEAVAIWMRGGETSWLDASAVAPGRTTLDRWPIRQQGNLESQTLISGHLPVGSPESWPG